MSFRCFPQSNSYPVANTLPPLVERPKLDETGLLKFDRTFDENNLNIQVMGEGTNPLSTKITRKGLPETPSLFDRSSESTPPEPPNESIQIPPSFAISEDDSHAPLAQTTPSAIKFGGLDDDFQEIDFDKELSKLPKKSTARTWVKF